MSKIFWDTNVFIYLFEDNAEFSPAVADLRLRMQKNKDDLMTSYLTLGEIQVAPRRKSQPERGLELAEALRKTCTLVPFDAGAAAAYVLFRERTNVKAPDALQLACAAASGSTFFVTNDKQLLSARVAEFDLFIVTPETIPI